VKKLSLGLCLLLFALPRLARAAPEDYASPLNFALEIHYSPVKYSNSLLDPGTGTSAGLSQSAAGFWAEWLPITRWGKLGLGLGYHYVFSRTTIYSTGDTAKLSANVAQIGASYRLDYLPNQYVVPYGRFALSIVFPHLIETVGGVETRPSLANQKGTELAFGAEALLDWIEPKSAGNLDRDQGINNMYLFAEYVKFTSPTGASADLSYTAVRGGMRVEF
jgi:hypothetical protein